MTEKDYDQIVKRAAWGLGPDWTVDPITVNGPLSVAIITYAHEQAPRDYCTLCWPVEEDHVVGQGGGSVLAPGEYNGRQVWQEGTLDEVTAFLREKVPGFYAPKKKWFGKS